MENKNMKSANIVKKVDVRATLMTFSIGDELVIRERDARYPTIYKIAKDVAKATGQRFMVTIAGIAEGTFVKRLS